MVKFFSAITHKVWGYDKSVILIVSYLFLVPFGRLSNIPVAIMALLGIKLLLTGAMSGRESQYRYFGMVFLCFWLPVLFSVPDAVNVAKTAKVAALYLQYFLVGLYIIYTLSSKPSRHELLLKICAFIIVFWVVDALFQAVVGYGLFGFRPRPGAINGIFGEDHPKMGIYLSALCSFAFVYGGRYWSGIIQCLVISGASSAVLLAGRRGGWIMLIVVLIGYVVWLLWGEKKLRLSRLIIVALLLVLAFGGAYKIYPPLKTRVNKTLLVFSGDLKKIDTATSYRSGKLPRG
jgi:O-antigen ligase